MKIGSLFSGIGGLDLGLERSGHEIVWQAENDAAASTILARQWPTIENLGDVTEVDWSTIGRPDAICAGNPCPDFSQAGQRKGMAGKHGQLWFEVVRAVRALRPRAVILENVPGIYTSPGLDLDAGESALGVVLSDLATLGYVGSCTCIRASDFGACHRRERFFLIAHSTSERGRQIGRRTSKHEADKDGGSPQANYVFGSSSQGKFRATPATDTISLAGPQARERQSRPRESSISRARGDERETVNGTSRRSGDSPAHPADDRLLGGRGRARTKVGETPYTAAEWGLYWPAISRWEQICGRPAPRPNDTERRLRPEFVEWMMGFDEGWTEGVAKTSRLRCLGNAVFVPVAEYLGSLV